jgi:hypothetical protein
MDRRPPSEVNYNKKAVNPSGPTAHIKLTKLKLAKQKFKSGEILLPVYTQRTEDSFPL